MRKVKVKTDGQQLRIFKQVILVIPLGFTLLSLFISCVLTPKSDFLNIRQLAMQMFVVNFIMLIIVTLAFVLLSKYSPIKSCAIRKKLILFTRIFPKSASDGFRLQSVEWHYTFNDEKLIIELFSNGFVDDKAILGRKLSEYLRMKLLKFDEREDKTLYIFGDTPLRLDGKGALMNDKL